MNFADCQSFLESNSPDILNLCQTNLNDSIDSTNFSMEGYFPLIRKDSSTHMHGLTAYVKEVVPSKWVVTLENSADSYLCFRLVLLHSLSHFFFLFRWHSSLLCAVFGSVSSNIDEVLLISPSANVFVFGGFNVHHTDWLTYFDGTDRPGELCYNLSQMTLLSWLPFLLRSQTVILIDCSFGFLSFLMLAFDLQWLSLHWEILIILLFPLTFQLIQNRIPRFIT